MLLSILSKIKDKDKDYANCFTKEHRTQLMRNHTAQHLFAWAVEQAMQRLVTQSNESDGSRELQHQGGSVHSDRFVVNTAIIDPTCVHALEHDALGFVRQIEMLCRDVIQQRLDVRRIQCEWSSLAKVFTLLYQCVYYHLCNCPRILYRLRYDCTILKVDYLAI